MPSPTVLAGGLVPGSDAPLIDGRKARGRERSSYPSWLNAEISERAPQTGGLKLASFFCGGGGFDLGFRAAGFELAFASDYWIGAVKSFTANLGHAPVHADIRELDASRLPAPGTIDVLTGGFPCVTFSTAGGRAGVVDDTNGKLYLELCRVIDVIKPRYFVAENVKGMLSANGGNAVRLIAAAFLRLGYRVEWKLVNMADHGVPQTRERVFFFGVRLDQWRGSFLFPKETHRRKGDKNAPVWLPPAVSLLDAIGDLSEPDAKPVVAVMHGDAARKMANAKMGTGVQSGYGNSKPRSATLSSHSQTASEPTVLILGVHNTDFHNRPRKSDAPCVAVTASRPPALSGGPANHVENNRRVSETYQASKRISWSSEPSKTQVADSENVVPWIDGMRRMTVRECARVQSFPDWYVFQGSAADGYRVIGNSVPPLYAKRLALAIVDYDAREIIQ